MKAIEQISEGFQAKMKTHNKSGGSKVRMILLKLISPDGEDIGPNVRFLPPRFVFISLILD